ncbi:hypothetical protein BKA69DRAFT_277196 [Paraphysoderma sedebokerense]|nr:hypothetical protein BKA69DRAFT_277196 [Paraphysoderma sedebokerense]
MKYLILLLAFLKISQVSSTSLADLTNREEENVKSLGDTSKIVNEVWNDNNTVLKSEDLLDEVCEPASPFSRRFRPLRKRNPMQHANTRRVCAENNQYVLVGYHGTCSNYQQNIENKLIIPPSNQAISGSFAELGRRFYTVDSPSIAFDYADLACDAHRSRHVLNSQEASKPIVCSVYLKSQALKSIPKIYYPPWIFDANDEPFDFLYEEENMDLVESIAKFPTKPVRFAGVSVTERTELQAAWPQHAVENMIARCSPVRVRANRGTSDIVRAGYLDLMEKSHKGSQHGEWGKPVIAAELFWSFWINRVQMKKGSRNVLRNFLWAGDINNQVNNKQ